MSDIFEFLGVVKDVIIAFPSAILELIYNTVISLISALNFIVTSLSEIPKIINMGLFDKLPSFFSYGLYSLLGVMLLVTVFKLYQMFKFW